MSNGNVKKVLFYFVSFLLAILTIEVGLQAINGLAFLLRKKKVANPLVLYHQDKKMADQIWQETWDARDRREYDQYLGWADKTYHGAYINEDAALGRKTWNPEAPQGRELEKVYFFGGSAAWGVGARDDFTIPSCLSRLLNSQGPRFQVFNYGVPGYVFTQGIIHLVLMLREGLSPRYVIFYDGFNEIYAAHQHGIAGTVHNLFMTRERLKLRYREVVWNGIEEAIRKYSMIYKAINELYLLITKKEQKYQEIAEKYSDEQLRSLSRDVVDDYKKSIKLLDRLSKAYDFRYICFWQPTMLTEHHLTKEESDIDIRGEDRALKKLCIYADEYLQKEKIPHFFLLTSALDKRPESIYLDVAHISEKGNEIIAGNIYEHLQKDLLADRQVSGGREAPAPPMSDIWVFPGAAAGRERQVRLRQWRQNAGLVN